MLRKNSKDRETTTPVVTVQNNHMPFIEDYTGNPDSGTPPITAIRSSSIEESTRKKSEEEAKRKALEDSTRKRAEEVRRKAAEDLSRRKSETRLDKKSSSDTMSPFSSTQSILKVTGFPAKNHPRNIYNFEESLKNPHRSFHDIDIVHKKGWDVIPVSAMKADFDNFRPDTYLLMREKSAPWHLLYLDENKQLSIIEIGKIKHLADILARKSPDQLSNTDMDAIRQIIKAYRTTVQNKKSPNTETRYFFKNSAVVNSEMIWLEAVNCGFYQLLAPYHVSSTKAIYDENNNFIAASSKGIPGFKSAREEPLREDDLYIDVLAKGFLTIDELELIDKRVREEGLQLDKLDKNYIITGKIVSVAFDGKNENAAPKSIQVTVKDLRNYRIVKGNAIGMTASRLNNEDDLHARNISKFGFRIDFDMSWWTIVYKFKSSGIVDWAFRYPSKNGFVITENDIRHFPNIKDSVPFYWPTNPAPIIPEYVLNALASIFAISQNAFTTQENAVYQKLEIHPVFIYHKFTMLLKYILTDAEMYRNIFKLHAPEDAKFESKYIIDMLTEEHARQIKAYREILTNMPEFREFLRHHGEHAFKSIITEFDERNKKYEKKIQRIDLELSELADKPERFREKFMEKFAIKRTFREQYISLRQTRRIYETIFKETMEKSDKNTIIAMDPEVSQMLAKSFGPGSR